jgi:ABC-2 type transport system permease protein
VGNMAFLLPGTWGEWVAKLLPGNAGSVLVMPVAFDPGLLSPWTGFAVFSAEVAALLLAGWLVFRHRDA